MTVSLAMSSAAASCCIWSTPPASTLARTTRQCATELDAYGGLLTDKIEIVALNKIDAVEPDELKKQKDRLKRAAKKTPLLLSGITGDGVKEALRALVDVIGESPGLRQGEERGRSGAVVGLVWSSDALSQSRPGEGRDP